MTKSQLLRDFDVKKPHIFLKDGKWVVHCMAWQFEEGFKCQAWLKQCIDRAPYPGGYCMSFLEGEIPPGWKEVPNARI